MRLKLIFSHSEKSFITLPCHYNEIIQGFIYRHLDSWLSEKVHEQGFKDPKTEQKLKFFTFSRLIPKEKAYVRDGKINLYGNVKLIVSSPIQDFIQSFAMNLMKACLTVFLLFIIFCHEESSKKNSKSYICKA